MQDAQADSDRKSAPELRGRLGARAPELGLASTTSPSEGGHDGPRGEGQCGAACLDPRLHAAWRQWLAALATDAEAVIAASHVYGELPPNARDAWLDALAEDAPRLAVPAIAIYAPLLAVESDPTRFSRIERAIGELPHRASTSPSTVALRGISADGSRVVALVAPLYLRFVRVLRCRYLPDEGFAWARHDPILRAEDAPRNGAALDGVPLEATPVKLVIEELAHAILAHRRKGIDLPGCLHLFADLFDAQIDADSLP